MNLLFDIHTKHSYSPYCAAEILFKHVRKQEIKAQETTLIPSPFFLSLLHFPQQVVWLQSEKEAQSFLQSLTPLKKSFLSQVLFAFFPVILENGQKGGRVAFSFYVQFLNVFPTFQIIQQVKMPLIGILQCHCQPNIQIICTVRIRI